MSKKPKKAELEALHFIAELIEGLQEQAATTNRHLEAMNANLVAFRDQIGSALASLTEYTGLTKDFPAILFSEEDLAKLDIREEADCYIVKPRKYLGGNTFGRISAIVRENGGQYVKSYEKGKGGHFILPKN